jgi:glycosyltransferase involved in cell wall biosynthesis
MSREFSDLKVAIVHEWLTTYAGSERVVEQMLEALPHADIFATVDFLPEKERSFLKGKAVRTTFIQKLPLARTKYRSYLPITPLAIEQHDLSGYDLIISSNHAVAKGVLTGPDQLHLCMCYSPMRYAWDLQHQYLRESALDHGVKGLLARWMLHKIRIWDIRASNGVDGFIAISDFIARRIRKTYRRESEVIYPPVEIDKFELYEKKEDFYLTASRMVPYKRVDLIVKAFAEMPEKKLVVIGDGPDFAKIRESAPKNVEMLGYRDFSTLKHYMQRARAFVFAAEEDFGIAPLEAQACGTPVIAFAKGGAVETIRGLQHPRPTGVFFDRQDSASLQAAVHLFDQVGKDILPASCRENALRFAPERFRKEFARYVHEESAKFFNISNSKEIV